MRPALAAAILLVASAGCLGPGSAFEAVGLDCTSTYQTVAATNADVLMPATMPGAMRESFGPRALVSVTAREGQTLTAAASWVPTAGAVEVLFDGSGTNRATTDLAWSSSGEVPAGEYTLELVGDPMAFQVVYTLYLSASGCTPSEG